MKRKKPAPRLNEKQTRFIREYLIDLNATQAAIRAGYSARTAYQIGSRLLKHVEVAALVEKRLAQRSEKLEITAEKVLEELGKIGFANMADYVGKTRKGVATLDLLALDRNKTAAIQEITVGTAGVVKFKLHNKHGALVDIGRHLGMFPSKVEFSGPDGGPIPVTDMTPQEFAARARKIADEV